jgi:predicted PurR-regulated permease PerM
MADHVPRREIAGGGWHRLQWVVVLGSGTLLLGVLYWAREVLVPVTIAALFAFLLTPVVSALRRRGLPHWLSVLLVVVTAVSALGGAGWVLADQVHGLARELPKYRSNIRQKAADLRDVGRSGVLAGLQRLMDDVAGEMERGAPADDRRKPMPVVVLADRQAVIRQLTGWVNPLVTVGLVLALTVFMLIRQVELRSRVIRLIGGSRLPVATKAIDEAAERIVHYVFFQTVINGTFGCAIALGLFLIGLPYAILWGSLAAALRFIPYVGAWVAALLPLTLALAVFQGWQQPLLVLGLFAVLEPLIFLVVEPVVYGTKTGVSDVALLVSVLFWTWLWGPVGLLLATPLTVCLAVLGKYVPALGFLGVLVGEAPELEPHVMYYQRLLARDEDEAASIVEEYARESAPDRVFDAVLLPALESVKRDRGRGVLSEDDARFIVSCTREIVEELGPMPPDEAAEERIRLLGCPARDELDELALLMFRRLVRRDGVEVEVVSATLFASEAVALARERVSDVVCIVTVPPGGVAHARYLIKRVRTARPDARILVGRWGTDGTHEEVRSVLLSAGADEVAMSLTEARHHVLGWLPVVESAEAVGPEARSA